MKSILLAFFLSAVTFGFAQDMPAYKIYDAQGKATTYKKMIAAMKGKEVVLFGELHNNPIAHWLQYEFTVSLNEKGDLVLGAEMIESDNQDELNDYLSGKINQKAFDTTARLWPNYKTDYKPLVDYARGNGIHFVAANIPRRFANKVFRGGFAVLDSLTDEEKSWIAPLPIEFDANLPRYQYILEMMGEHGTPELVMAQATKDATMAYFIVENLKANSTFIHYNGAFHSDFYEGIGWYLKKYKPEITVGTITTVSQADINKLEEEHIGQADFIICVDENMTTTH